MTGVFPGDVLDAGLGASPRDEARAELVKETVRRGPARMPSRLRRMVFDTIILAGFLLQRWLLPAVSQGKYDAMLACWLSYQHPLAEQQQQP